LPLTPEPEEQQEQLQEEEEVVDQIAAPVQRTNRLTRPAATTGVVKEKEVIKEQAPVKNTASEGSAQRLADLRAKMGKK